jgi:hypothetical protein
MPRNCASFNLLDELFFNRKKTILMANNFFLVMLWRKQLVSSKLSNVAGKAFLKNNFEIIFSLKFDLIIVGAGLKGGKNS